jgi:hypothetical protein
LTAASTGGGASQYSMTPNPMARSGSLVRTRRPRGSGRWYGRPMSDRPGQDGIDPSTVASRPVPPRSGAAEAVGRAMLGLGDIIEGKPPRDTYEIVMVVDESGEPEGPEDLIIEI